MRRFKGTPTLRQHCNDQKQANDEKLHCTRVFLTKLGIFNLHKIHLSGKKAVNRFRWCRKEDICEMYNTTHHVKQQERVGIIVYYILTAQEL